MNEPENFWTIERIKEWHVKNERIIKLEAEIEALKSIIVSAYDCLPHEKYDAEAILEAATIEYT